MCKVPEKIVNFHSRKNGKFPVDVQPSNLQKAVTYTVLPGVQLKSQVFLDNLHYRYYKTNICKNKM